MEGIHISVDGLHVSVSNDVQGNMIDRLAARETGDPAGNRLSFLQAIGWRDYKSIFRIVPQQDSKIVFVHADMQSGELECDGLTTEEGRRWLQIFSADCPSLIVSMAVGGTPYLAHLHLGRHPLQKGILKKFLDQVPAKFSRKNALVTAAVLTPGIRKCCYRLKLDSAARRCFDGFCVDAGVGEVFLDLPGFIKHRLAERPLGLGSAILAKLIEVPHCTCCSREPRFFSHYRAVHPPSPKLRQVGAKEVEGRNMVVAWIAR